MKNSIVNREAEHRAKPVPGGLGAGTKLLTADGNIKKIENIKVGDRLIDEFGHETQVIGTEHGEGELFRVSTLKGEGYTATGSYMLLLEKRKYCEYPESMTVRVNRWLEIPDIEKRYFTPVRIKNLVKFPETEGFSQYPIDPYFLGVLLGDGCFCDSSVSITTMDQEVADEIYRQAGERHMNIRVKPAGLARTYYLMRNGTTDGTNFFNEELRNLGLYGCRCEDKFVLDEYLHGDIDTRRALTAGLLDTDGSLEETGYDFLTKSRTLAYNMAFLCHSIGLRTSVGECTKGCQNGFKGRYYRMYISGDCQTIPCRVRHKKIMSDRQIRTVVKRLFITPAGTGRYYSLITDGNHTFLLDDFTIASDAVYPGEL